MYGHPKMCPVKQVENLSANRNLVSSFEPERLAERQIHCRNSRRPEGIPSHRAILGEVRQQAELIGDGEALHPILTLSDALGLLQSIGQVAIEISIAAGQDGKRLAGLEGTDAAELPTAQVLALRKERQIPDEAADEAMAHVEARAGSLDSTVETVLRQNGAAGQIEQIGYFVYRVRPG